jgi:hypothetical protein
MSDPQHSLAPLQNCAPLPQQAPPSQPPPQQSCGSAQRTLAAWHVAHKHWPPTHAKTEQQFPSTVHAPPRSTQAQVPPGQSKSPQQSPSVAQGSPRSPQSQIPAVHASPAQQSEVPPHVYSRSTQGLQTLPRQSRPAQQSAAVPQVCPFVAQMRVQAPDAHMNPEQQTLEPVQIAPATPQPLAQ